MDYVADGESNAVERGGGAAVVLVARERTVGPPCDNGDAWLVECVTAEGVPHQDE